MYSTFDAKRMRAMAAATALALVLALGLAVSAYADPSGGRNGTRVQRQKPRIHANYSRHTEVQRTDDGDTRTSTATGAKGGTVERNVVATHDQENPSWVRDVTVERTTPAGN